MPLENSTSWNGTHGHKRLLLQVARRAITLAAERRELLEDLSQDEKLVQLAGAFVTLRRRNRLRGCIGQLASNVPLVRVVAYCARAAALEDPRFDAVRVDELAEIEIELSILSPPRETSPEQIEAGLHGLIVSRGWQCGVLLPQVAMQFDWPAERFLEETCVKAGLERDAWKDPATRVQAFTAEVFSESDVRAESDGPPEAPGRVRSRYSSSM